MQQNRIKIIIPVFLVLIIAMCMIGPVSATNGTITIEYKGAGGYLIGDSINFHGKNTVGNVTVLKITGPGLPSAGVPLYNVAGIPGSGNTVQTDMNHNWYFSWDSNRAVGGNLLQTARYTITAYDRDHPEINSTTTSIMLKKPEFYVVASKNPAGPGDYVTLTGSAENGISYVRIDITDPSGNILHTFMSPVSATGYFEYGFHVDMPEGEYRVVVSNPSMKSGLNQSLTVTIPTPVQTNLTQKETTPAPTPVPTTPAPAATSPIPTRVPLSPICAIAGITGAIALFWTVGRKNM